MVLDLLTFKAFYFVFRIWGPSLNLLNGESKNVKHKNTEPSNPGITFQVLIGNSTNSYPLRTSYVLGDLYVLLSSGIAGSIDSIG